MSRPGEAGAHSTIDRAVCLHPASRRPRPYSVEVCLQPGCRIRNSSLETTIHLDTTKIQISAPTLICSRKLLFLSSPCTITPTKLHRRRLYAEGLYIPETQTAIRDKACRFLAAWIRIGSRYKQTSPPDYPQRHVDTALSSDTSSLLSQHHQAWILQVATELLRSAVTTSFQTKGFDLLNKESSFNSSSRLASASNSFVTVDSLSDTKPSVSTRPLTDPTPLTDFPIGKLRAQISLPVKPEQTIVPNSNCHSPFDPTVARYCGR
jgi:hypothetical protein